MLATKVGSPVFQLACMFFYELFALFVLDLLNIGYFLSMDLHFQGILFLMKMFSLAF